MQLPSIAAARRRLWIMVAFAHLAAVAMLASTKVLVAPTAVLRFYGLMLALACLVPVVRAKGTTRLAGAFEPLLAGLLVTVPILLSTYAAMSFAMPLADGRLAAIDAALGFDWHGFVAALDAQPLLSGLLGLAYVSFCYQLIFLTLWLPLRGKAERACAFIFAYALLCLSASALGVWYPALGTYVFYGVDPAGLRAIDASFGFTFLQQFHAVRDSAAFTLDFGAATGILTFPSVHAGMAVLCAWAAWDCRILRWPMLALDAAMAVSALSHGSHYLADVMAGAGLAAFVVSLTTALFRDAAQTAPRRPAPAGRAGIGAGAFPGAA